MAAKDKSSWNMAPKEEGSTSKKSSTAPPRRHQGHSGLRFNFNVKNDRMSESFVSESRTEKQKGNAVTVTKNIVETRPIKDGCTASHQSYQAHSEMKSHFNVKKGGIVESFFSESRTEKGKGNAVTVTKNTVETRSIEDGCTASHRNYQANSGLKSNLNIKNDGIVESCFSESRTEKGKASHQSYQANTGLKSNLNVKNDGIVESFFSESRTEKGKGNALTVTKSVVETRSIKDGCTPSPRMHQGHSGLKFNFNVKKDRMSESLLSESRTEKEKGNAITATEKIEETLTTKKKCSVSVSGGDRVTITKVNVRMEILQNSIHKTQLTNSALSDSAILTENEENDLCNTAVKSLRVIQTVPQTSACSSKVMNSQKPTQNKEVTFPKGSYTRK